jgi:sugar transferase (PEP-CTERM/EpsH1 system associated)
MRDDQMSDVLLLVHRLPYPPDKGDKVRSYHLLRQLRHRFRVHLGCFVDDANDRQYVATVQALCTSSKIVRLQPGLARLKSTTALLRKQALSIPYYFDRELAEWVDFTLRSQDIAYIVVYSSPMAQYVLRANPGDPYRVMDFVDVDSDKWNQYAEKRIWPVRRLYSREARLLAGYERQVAREFDAVSFVTRNEVDLFDSVSPETRDKHHVVPNGVETGYFDPDLDCSNPFADMELPLVFTGMMNYWPNVDAVSWFAHNILPGILDREPRARLWIVGAAPTREVRSLQSLHGVTVTGRVPDVRPYLKHAALAVAPLRIARGVQNKVLEAMAMGCRVLCSAQAAAGLQHAASAPVAIARAEHEFVTLALQLLSGSAGNDDSDTVRQYVLDNYNWEVNLSWFLRQGAKQGARQPVVKVS